MSRFSFKHNSRAGIIAVATALFTALPMVCFPLGLRNSMTPAMAVSYAYRETSGKTATEVVNNGEEDLDVYTGEMRSGLTADLEANIEPTETGSSEISKSFSDIPKYIVSQRYDDSDLPIELLDVQCFAPDDSTYYIRASQSILKETPDMESKTLVSLHVGQEVKRIGIGDTWSKIRITDKNKNEYEGYVLTNTIQDTMVSVPVDRAVWVDTDSLIVRAEPSTSSEEVAVVNDEAKLECSAIVGDKWYKVTTSDGKQGYVYMSYTTTNPPPTPTPTPTPRPRSSSSSGGGGGSRSVPSGNGSDRDVILDYAEYMLGKPYIFGGTSSSGVDCAGLVTYCYSKVGISVANGSNTIYNYYGTNISRDELQPGDVICYDYGGWCGHVAIYIGDGQVIHASASKGVVKYGILDMMPIIAYKRFL